MRGASISPHHWKSMAGSILLAITSAMAGQAEDPPEWQAAYAAMKAGDQALQRRDYEAAAREFDKAQRAFEQIDIEDKQQQAEKYATYCLKQQIYAHNQRLIDALAAAEATMNSGSLREGAERMRELAVEFRELAEKYKNDAFANNAVHCLGQSGLLPIKRADEARSQGRWAEAVEGYEVAIDAYEKAHQILGEERFANNLTYARSFLPEVRLELCLANRNQLPNLQLERIDGGTLSLADLRGKKTLLVFWAHWCNICRNDLPILENFWRTHRGDGIAVLGICLSRSDGFRQGDAAQAVSLVRESLTFPNAWPTPQFFDVCGCPDAVPFGLWIDEEGRIIARANLTDVSEESLADQIPRSGIADGSSHAAKD